MNDERLILGPYYRKPGGDFRCLPVGLYQPVLATLDLSAFGHWQRGAEAKSCCGKFRMPRALAAFITGAGLAASGAALQGLLRNPLAEPGVLGVSAAAALGATLALFYGAASLSPMIVLYSGYYRCAWRNRSFGSSAAMRTASMVTLILIGIGLSSFAGALMALLLNLAPTPFTLSDLISWSLGSVANRSFSDIALTLPFIAIGAVLLMLSKRNLSALTLGESTAQGLGVNLKQTRLLIISWHRVNHRRCRFACWCHWLCRYCRPRILSARLSAMIQRVRLYPQHCLVGRCWWWQILV